jgi:hypothetical protein
VDGEARFVNGVALIGRLTVTALLLLIPLVEVGMYLGYSIF